MSINLKSLLNTLDKATKVGTFIWLIVGALIGAVVWVTTIQLAVAENTQDIKDLKQHISPIDAIRQDVRWIKKRLGGPDN